MQLICSVIFSRSSLISMSLLQHREDGAHGPAVLYELARSDLNAARTSAANSSRCSNTTKCPPLVSSERSRIEFCKHQGSFVGCDGSVLGRVTSKHQPVLQMPPERKQSLLHAFLLAFLRTSFNEPNRPGNRDDTLTCGWEFGRVLYFFDLHFGYKNFS